MKERDIQIPLQIHVMATAKLATVEPSIVKDRIFASSLAAKMVASELCQVRDFPIYLPIMYYVILHMYVNLDVVHVEFHVRCLFVTDATY